MSKQLVYDVLSAYNYKQNYLTYEKDLDYTMYSLDYIINYTLPVNQGFDIYVECVDGEYDIKQALRDYIKNFNLQLPEGKNKDISFSYYEYVADAIHALKEMEAPEFNSRGVCRETGEISWHQGTPTRFLHEELKDLLKESVRDDLCQYNGNCQDIEGVADEDLDKTVVDYNQAWLVSQTAGYDDFPRLEKWMKNPEKYLYEKIELC